MPTTNFTLGERVWDGGLRVGHVIALYEGKQDWEEDLGVCWDSPSNIPRSAWGQYGVRSERSANVRREADMPPAAAERVREWYASGALADAQAQEQA